MNKSLQKLQIISQDGQVDLKYFISFALEGMISWTVLEIFLNDLTPDFSKSKELNKILLEQLQVLQDRLNIGNVGNLGTMENEYNADEYDSNVFDDKIETKVKQDTGSDDFETELDPEYENHEAFNNFEEDQQFQDISEPDQNIPTDEDYFKELEAKNPQLRIEIKCEICGKKFQTFFAFTKHMKKVHEVKKLEKKTASKEMKLEAGIHFEDKSLQCQTCFKTLKSKGAMKYHVKTHYQNQEKPFECELCRKKFTSINGLKYHLETHTKNCLKTDSPFQCKICNKGLNTAEGMKYHEKTHDLSRKKAFICDFCSKTFISWNGLQNHNKKCNADNMSN